MASSAGLRTTHPVIRFADEFGSLGSNPTPALMQQKVYRDLFECREENYIVNDRAANQCPDFVGCYTIFDVTDRTKTFLSMSNAYYTGFFYKDSPLHPVCDTR